MGIRSLEHCIRCSIGSDPVWNRSRDAPGTIGDSPIAKEVAREAVRKSNRQGFVLPGFDVPGFDVPGFDLRGSMCPGFDAPGVEQLSLESYSSNEVIPNVG